MYTTTNTISHHFMQEVNKDNDLYRLNPTSHTMLLYSVHTHTWREDGVGVKVHREKVAKLGDEQEVHSNGKLLES